MDQPNGNSTSAPASDTTTEPRTESSDAADLAKLVADKRREAGIVVKDAPRLERSLPPVPVARQTQPSLTDEQLAIRDARILEREREAEWESFGKVRGVRYLECRLVNFKATSEKQRTAVKTLLEYCEAVAENVRYGRGVVLFGPRGTGKDHLAMAVARAAILAGHRVLWRNGMDLFGDFRDAIDDDKSASESVMVARLVKPDVLYMSDPLPVVGPMSPHQMNMLFRILDGRYSQCKATICTLNVANGEELCERMGPQNADRLKDGALAIHCNWESYRKAIQ